MLPWQLAAGKLDNNSIAPALHIPTSLLTWELCCIHGWPRAEAYCSVRVHTHICWLSSGSRDEICEMQQHRLKGCGSLSCCSVVADRLRTRDDALPSQHEREKLGDCQKLNCGHCGGLRENNGGFGHRRGDSQGARVTGCGKEDVKHSGGDGTREDSCQYPTTYQLLHNIPVFHYFTAIPILMQSVRGERC